MTKPDTKEPPMTVLERLKELEEKATNGPWINYPTCSGRWRRAGYINGPHKTDVAYAYRDKDRMMVGEPEANAALIAAMRNALPHLIAVAEAAKAHLEALPRDDWYKSDEAMDGALAALMKETPDAG